MRATPLDAFHRQVWYAALVVYAITAWFSSGYYAADEHYQVIAFAQAKLGELPVADLPWEYEAHMRSALLPGIAYVVIGASRSLITANPFHIAFLLRLITALLALVVVRSFVRAVMSEVSDGLQRPFILLSYFLWFLPYQHVRFAAETWSGLLFLFGIAQLVGKRESSWNLLLTGLCFGLSIQVKPVMGIACLGAIAWVLFANKYRRAPLLQLSAGLVTALAFGFLLDYWFYGACTPTLWNYRRLAVVGDPSHTFETFPWYYYIPWMMKYGIWPIGVLVVGALVWITYRQPRTLVVWCVWPYLIVLSAIPHKELRFLFPLVDLAPLVLALAWQELERSTLFAALRDGHSRQPVVAGAYLLILLNMIALGAAGTTTAGSGRTKLAAALWNTAPDTIRTLGYTAEEPWIWDIRIPGFYLPPQVEDMGTHDPCAEVHGGTETIPTDLLIGYAGELSASDCTPLDAGYGIVARSASEWATELMGFYNDERSGPYVLYQHDPAPSRPSEP